MFPTHPQVMNVNVSTVLTGKSHMMRWGGNWGWAPLEVSYHLYSFQSVQLQVVLAVPLNHAVDFLPVGGLSGPSSPLGMRVVVVKLKEFDRRLTAGAAVG